MNISSAKEAVEELCNTAEPYYHQIQSEFNMRTQSIHFGLFSILYTFGFILFIKMCCGPAPQWKARNRELKTFKKKVKDSLFSFVFSLPIISYIINRKFQQQLDKEEVKIISQLQKHWDHRRSSSLPTDGMNEDNLRRRILEWKQKQRVIWDTGKVSGAFYVTEQEHQEEMNKFAAMYMYHNPLHLSTYKELIKLQKEVLDMTNSLLTDPKDRKQYFGAITSGGSQSLIAALYAYRNHYPRSKPNIVIPVTAHAAIDKGCFYFNIQIRKAKLAANYEVDMAHLESLIDKNTIMILGSAPNYPHGIIDPIDKLAQLAKKKGIGFHIDACLGGFVGAFSKDHKHLYSLDRDGVTSISLDHHKFALAPKGISTIFYKTRELRHSQYYINMDWKGGLYATVSLPGSRSGFASAAAWYSMTQVTKKGYKQNAQVIIDATIKGAERLRKIQHIEVFGKPNLCVIAFNSTHPKCSHLDLSDFLKHERGWNISSIHKPNGIHISVTMANAQSVKNKLAQDIKDAFEHCSKNNQGKLSMSSQLYGTTAKIPTNGMQNDILRLLMGASVK